MSVAYGMVPHIGQQRVIDAVIDGPEKYITVVSPRQTGKSLLLINLILYYAINDKTEPVIGVISPVYIQVRKLMEDLLNAISDSGIVESSNFSNHEVKLKTGAKIKFRSSEREDSLRGETFSYLFLDEAAYQSESAWKNAILPTALVKGKKVILFSTPKGKDWFYEMYMMGLNPEFKNYKSVRMFQGENPLIDMEEIEAARKSLPSHIYKAEYEGEFIEGDNSLFINTKELIYQGVKYGSGKIYCGIDLARQKDYTVATFIDDKGLVFDIFRINLTSWDHIIKELIAKIKKYNAIVIVELNSIGDVIFDQLKKEWNNIEGFYTTNESKKEIIENLIMSFNLKEIFIPDNKDLLQELDVFEMSYNPISRSVKYAARPPFNDDMVISLALANYLRKKNKVVGSYAVVGRKR